MTISLLAFEGSGRPGSLNAKVLDIVVEAVRAKGVKVTRVNLRDYHLPIYEMDDEQNFGLPEAALKLKELFNSHQGFLIASPEYNGAPSALLKNAIDWMSRRSGDEPPLHSFKGKVAGIIAASPGKIGGLRGLYQLNTILFILGTIVLPDIVSVNFAAEAFEGDKLKREADQKAVETMATRITHFTKALNS